jgi:hypothetical protein
VREASSSCFLVGDLAAIAMRDIGMRRMPHAWLFLKELYLIAVQLRQQRRSRCTVRHSSFCTVGS